MFPLSDDLFYGEIKIKERQDKCSTGLVRNVERCRLNEKNDDWTQFLDIFLKFVCSNPFEMFPNRFAVFRQFGTRAEDAAAEVV